MGLSSLGAPLVLPQSSNEADLGVSLMVGGCGLMDSRYGYKAGAASKAAIGFFGITRIPVIDQVPSTATTTAIAAAQAPTSGTALTLVSATGAGITYLAAALTVQPSGNVIPVGALAIDGSPGLVSFGSTGKIQLYDPTKAIARTVQIASNGNDSSGYFIVTGWDLYGYPQTEKITGANAGTAVGKKAFKFIKSIVPGGTIASTSVSAGQSDTYGFPIRIDEFANIEIYWGTNNNNITANNTGTFTFANTTNPATNTTGDVRGTYAVATASNNTLKMQMFATPSVADILAYTGSYPTGLFGTLPA